MKKILIVGITFFVQFAFAQIDVETIKKNIIENPKDNYYALLEIFNTNPAQLSQEKMNQLYYGSKFLKSEYSIGDYNKDYDKIWKPAQKKLSKNKAEKIVKEAESKYLKNPLNREILDDMTNIYNALGNEQKANLCVVQKDIITNTIEKSGNGKTDETPICVIRPGDVLAQLDRFSFVDRTKFEQKSRQLSDGSILTMYKMGNEVYYVKLVGGYY